MYKKQMTLQRVTCYLLLVAAALVFFYSLGIMTDIYDSLYLSASYDNPRHPRYVEGASIFYDMQGFNRNLTTAGIVLILSAVSLFVARTEARRKYYIANYLTVGVNFVLNIAVSVWGLINVFQYRAAYLKVDFEKLKEVALDTTGSKYFVSTFWFDISLAVFIPVIFMSLLSLFNLVWKVMLMKSEKALLASGKESAEA